MKCTLSAGIENISGTMKGKDGKNLTFRTYTRLQADGTYKKETRVYMFTKHERTKPFSESEQRQHELFARFAEYWKSMPEETKKTYHENWKRAEYHYNGKKYATLRGYVMARFMAEQKLATGQTSDKSPINVR